MMKTKSLVLGSLLGILLVLLTSTTAWAAQRTLTADGNGGYYINMPATGVDTLVIPETITKFHVYDDLGTGRGFSTNCNGSLLLTAPNGKKLQVEGTLRVPYYVREGRGTLTIYDGSNDAARKLVNTYSNESISRKLSTSENMYINFTTNENQMSGYEGLDLTVTVDDPNGPHAIAFNSVYNGSINSSLSQATAGTPITITANSDEGYILDGVRVVDILGNELDVEGGKWYSSNTASFTMPQTDVTVSATFSELSGTFYLDVVQSGPDSYVIPSGVNKVRLRIMGPQNEKADKSFSLSAPEGYALLMRGDVYGRECEDSLYIYDGSSADGNELLRSAGCSEFNNVVSSGENVVLHYKEMGSRYYPGEAVYMYVNVVDLNATYNIVANENMYNGNFSSSHETANGNTLVTLTAHPDSGYVLQGFYVRDENDNSVYVRGGEITNTATFVMPFSNVTITPQFTEVTDNYLTLSMPDTGRLVADIPEGIQKFMIDRCRGNRCDNSVLVLKAPEGRRVQLGPLWGHLLEKPLRVYDGADSNTTLLFSRTVDAEYENTSIDAPYGRYVSSGEYMTVVYEKDKNGYEESFNLPAVIVNPNEPHVVAMCNDNNNDYIDDCDWNGNNEDGVITSAVNSAIVNTQVSLSAVPNEGKWLNRIRVKDRFGSIAVSGGTWYTSADVTFTMPATDVWFEGYYATELTAEGGLTIEKPRDEMLEVEIPDDVESFAINGTRDLSCSSTAPSEPLILKAPAGKIMQLEDNYGNDYEAYYSSFKVFNGRIENPVAADPDPIEGNVSSGTMLTIVDYPSHESLVVRLRDVSDSPHKVTVVKKGNCDGSFTAGNLNLDEVLVGTTVAMTVTPNDGCVLHGLHVVGSENGDEYFSMASDPISASEEFSFMMPLEDVNVVATFVDPNAEYDILPGEYVTNATVTSNLAKAKVGDTVVLTVIPDKDYILGEVEVWWIDENGDRQDVDITGGTWYDNEVKFTMPAADVYYEPRLAYYTYAYYYVDFNLRIPQTGNLVANIPEEVNSFEIYDNGYYGEYSNNSDGSLTITAPEGYSLYVGGIVWTAEEADSLVIYDGADVNAPKLLKKYGEEEFYGIYSSGRSLTFRFKSNAEEYNDGLHLYVTVLQKSGSGAVAIYEANGYKVARINGAYSGKDTVNIEEDIEVDDVEFNREFSTVNDGYSTLMLPFDVYAGQLNGVDTILAFSAIEDMQVDGKTKKIVVVENLWSSSDYSEDVMLQANTPYLVKMWNSQLSIDGPVTLRKTENTVLELGDGWQVHGTTAYKKWQTGDPELGSVYGFAANAKDSVKVGQFVKAGSGAYIKPFRAYLLHNASNPEPRPAPANHVSVWRDNELPEEIDIVVVGGGKRAGIAGGETQEGDGRTVIGTINTRTGEIKFKSTYDLKGRPVSGTPKAKGMYIKGKR